MSVLLTRADDAFVTTMLRRQSEHTVAVCIHVPCCPQGASVYFQFFNEDLRAVHVLRAARWRAWGTECDVAATPSPMLYISGDVLTSLHAPLKALRDVHGDGRGVLHFTYR